MNPQTLNSRYKTLGPVVLPPYKARQKYYIEFDLADVQMPEGYEDYKAPIQQLVRAAGAFKGTAYVTVDEKIVTAGMSQRRPDPHVDGCFTIPVHGQAMWGHPQPTWNHYCNDVPGNTIARMSVIVAANVEGCKAWDGLFQGSPKSNGDLSHIADQLGRGEVLPANTGYLLSPDCVHESLRFSVDTERSFLRIALPTTFQFTH